MITRLACLFLLFPFAAHADSVVTNDRVENNVNIRLDPDASSDVVGRLNKGESLELVAEHDGWYEVQLEGDATGFISADWTEIVADADVEPIPEPVDVVEEETEPQPEAVVEEAVAAEAADVVDEVVEPEPEVVVEGTVESEPEAVAEEATDELPVPVAAEESEGVAEAVVEVVADVEPEPETETEIEVAPEPEPVVEEKPQPPPAVVAEPLALKGKKDFLVRFRSQTEGGASQIYDDGNRIGIGTTEPQQRLEVNGSIQINEQNSSVAGLMITQSTGDTGYIMHNRASTLTIGAGSQDRITIDRAGNVGIAVARPKHPLEMASGAYVSAGGVWTNRSSRESKQNIESLTLEEATAALMSLRPVTFEYREDDAETYAGFVAEEVPDLVAMADRESLSAMDIVAVLTRVVQEQQKKINELEARLAE